MSNTELMQPEEYRGAIYDDRVLYIWLFDEDVINNNSCCDIVANNMYLIRYDFTLQDLEDLNWAIEYTWE